MKAFILAAGLGTRLAPLTNHRPKAMVEVGGLTMLEHLILKLKSVGITSILINVHHHSELVIDFLQNNVWKGLSIEISDESGQLLDTGGAIKKAEDFFKGNENILVHNVDVITEVDFSELQKKHNDNKSIVSLCVRNRKSSRGLLFDDANKLCGWTNNSTSEFKWVDGEPEDYTQKAFSGVYLASPEFAEKLPFDGQFSIIDAWLKMAKIEKISAYDDVSPNWFDLGSIEKIKIAEEYLKEKEYSQRFLEKVASKLRILSQEELIKTAIILPNKRSVTFLKKYLNNERVNPLWLPDFLSIDEFMEKLSGISKADPLNLYFDLYEIHKQKEAGSAKSPEIFLSWAPMIIRDFNDIDLYLTNAESVLQHITEARAIKEWNLDGQELSSLQKSYINFYQSLFSYYENLKHKMLKNENAYPGFIYRYNAENIETLSKRTNWEYFVFAGFNALSPSEEKVFGHIKNNFNTSVFLDADEYYINKQKDIPLQEAGININRLINNWNLSDFKWLTNRLTNNEKNICFHEVQGQIGQVKLAGNLLQGILNKYKKENKLQLINETAIVLANENLLLPLLGSLPEKYNDNKENIPISYNVTLGYPINYSPIKGFINDWFKILVSRQNHRSKQFRTQPIINLFLNNILISGMDKEQKTQLDNLSSKFIKNNISFIGYDEISKMLEPLDGTNIDVVELLFADVSKVNELLSKLVDLLLFLLKGINSTNAGNKILKEQITLLLKISKRLSITLESNTEHLDIKTFSILFFQLLSNYELSLKGEPLSGIQIMGMLETRALDFKNIIILSVNEGIIPKTGIPDSFIPFDIRSAYGLPLPKDKNVVLSYHFFRLLQFAENIDIIYDASAEGLGVGEPSRFLRQIELELIKNNNKINLNKTRLSLPNGIANKEIIIKNNEDSLKALREKAKSGFSPSALNSYIMCKLKFYFQYILKLIKEDEIEASVESNTFGLIIHDTLEELYSPYKGKLIDAEQLKQSINKTDVILKKYFIEHYKTKNINQGKNLLFWEVSKKYIRNFILAELKDLKVKQRKIISLEDKIKIQFNTSKNDVFLSGTIDRIDSDSNGENIRVVDYKTGKVEAKDLKPADLSILLTDIKYSKSFQVLFYKFIYLKSLGINGDDIRTGIISLRNLSNGFLEFGLKEDNENTFEEFGEILQSLIDEIFNPQTTFTQTDNTDACKYCDYKNICNR